MRICPAHPPMGKIMLHFSSYSSKLWNLRFGFHCRFAARSSSALPRSITMTAWAKGSEDEDDQMTRWDFYHDEKKKRFSSKLLNECLGFLVGITGVKSKILWKLPSLNDFQVNVCTKRSFFYKYVKLINCWNGWQSNLWKSTMCVYMVWSQWPFAIHERPLSWSIACLSCFDKTQCFTEDPP